ncbi:MAG: signal peptidase I, partial [bacterium]|nr:signal peptidase I [bacterium]
DYLIISKLGLSWSNVKQVFGSKDKIETTRGNIIVFRAPNSNLFFVKRIIGLPKERVVIKDGQVKIFNKDNPQGFVLKENYINQKTEGDLDQIIDPDYVFVLGDNRTHNGSFDSRYFGPLSKENIIGNATLRLLPANHMEIIKNPNY